MIRILIADDSAAARDGLRSILGAYPDIQVVAEAVDGLEAVAEAERVQPEVILMDAQMPSMDGVEATRLIKQRLPHVMVLFLAVHRQHVEEAMAAGADGHLMKDSGRQELLSAIRRLGRRSQKQGGATGHNPGPPDQDSRPRGRSAT